MNTANGPPAGSRKRSGIGKTLFIAGLPAAQTLPAQLELKEALAKHLGRWATVKYVKLVHPRAVNARVKCAFASFHVSQRRMCLRGRDEACAADAPADP